MKVKSSHSLLDSQQKARQVHLVQVRLGGNLQRKRNWKSSKPVSNQPSMKKTKKEEVNTVEHLP